MLVKFIYFQLVFTFAIEIETAIFLYDIDWMLSAQGYFAAYDQKCAYFKVYSKLTQFIHFEWVYTGSNF